MKLVYVNNNRPITHFTSGIENKTQTLVTPKGMAYIHKTLTEHGRSASA